MRRWACSEGMTGKTEFWLWSKCRIIVDGVISRACLYQLVVRAYGKFSV